MLADKTDATCGCKKKEGGRTLSLKKAHYCLQETMEEMT